jgi:23S rRNA (adenine2503-C2)-methyltransferase
MKMKKNILNINKIGLKRLLEKLELKPFVANQLFDWIYKKNVLDFDSMSNISQTNKDILKENLVVNPFIGHEKIVSRDKLAIKYVFTLLDNERVEAVVLKERGYYSLCVSSQAGCKLKCKYCLTGINGYKRDLTQAEIIGQLLIALQDGYNITHVVFMGMGEPLLNISNVLKAIDTINNEEALNISKRKVIVSTSGILEGIRFLIENKVVLNLALSVGCVNSEKRLSIMPVEKNNAITEVARLLKEYQQLHNRKLTLEYTLLDGINDKVDDIQELINLAHYLSAKINLINLNEHEDIPFRKLDSKKIGAIKDEIQAQGITATIRFKKGEDINAACGLLSRNSQ